MINIQPICVGPVQSLEEARRFESSGAQELLLLCFKHPMYCASRVLSLDTLKTIVDANLSCKLGLIVAPGQNLDLLERLFADDKIEFVEIYWRLFKQEDRNQLMRNISVDVQVSGFWVDYDEDPSWPREQMSEIASATRIKHFVLSVLPSLLSPFQYLRHEAWKYEEGVKMSDVLALCDDFPISINADWSNEEERGWFLDNLPLEQRLMFYLNGENHREAGSMLFVNPNSLEISRLIGEGTRA